jgi:DNA-binding NarL/FixJ family response regulator
MDITYPIAIAVVDDHALVREGMSNMLMQMGFPVILQAEHGRDLLSQLATALILPDLCLLDINMPVMNGMETTIAMKQEWPGIKIVGYTFNSDQAEKMLKCGADGCLQKCRDVSELKKMILDLMGLI